jgi:iron complex outermembrane recepter protein
VRSAYAELAVPLVSKRPGVQSLELSAAGRLNSFANSTTYKLGLRYNPTDVFAVRGTVTTAFRAPSVAELYRGTADGFPNVSDQLIRGLTASIDYYAIEVDNAIQAIGSGIILASCYQQEGGDRRFCDRIQRDGAGFIQSVLDLDTNVGGFRAEGIDVGLKYRTPGFGFGRLGAGIDGTLLLDLTQIQADGFEQSYVGNYDQSAGAAPGANPRYRLSAFLRWALDPFNAGVNFRYLPSFEECEGGPCNVNSIERPIQRTVDDYFYIDVFAGVNLLFPFGTTRLTVGVNNVTDAIPPYIANGFLAQSDAATYDYAGRSFYLRLTQEL